MGVRGRHRSGQPPWAAADDRLRQSQRVRWQRPPAKAASPEFSCEPAAAAGAARRKAHAAVVIPSLSRQRRQDRLPVCLTATTLEPFSSCFWIKHQTC